VEDGVVVVSAARELDEVAAGLGRVLVVHLGGRVGRESISISINRGVEEKPLRRREVGCGMVPRR
jgi:hypothetical protein